MTTAARWPQLQPGTRVAIEGPYGAFTADARQSDRVALIGAGVGHHAAAGTARGPAEARGRGHDRPCAPPPRMLILREELQALLHRRGAQLHELIGSRERVPLLDLTLARLIPDIADRDIYICGPTGFTASVRRAARALGIPDARIHHETFAF